MKLIKRIRCGVCGKLRLRSQVHSNSQNYAWMCTQETIQNDLKKAKELEQKSYLHDLFLATKRSQKK